MTVDFIPSGVPPTDYYYKASVIAQDNVTASLQQAADQARQVELNNQSANGSRGRFLNILV